MPALLKLFLLPGKIMANLLYLFPSNHMEAVRSARHKDNPVMHAFYTCGLILIGGLIFLNWKPHERVQPRQPTATMRAPSAPPTPVASSETASHSDTGEAQTALSSPETKPETLSTSPSEAEIEQSPRSIETYFEQTLFQNAVSSDDSASLNMAWDGIAIINHNRSNDPCRNIEFGFNRVNGDRPWEQRFCPADDGLWIAEGSPYKRDVK